MKKKYLNYLLSASCMLCCTLSFAQGNSVSLASALGLNTHSQTLGSASPLSITFTNISQNGNPLCLYRRPLHN